jgi:hypothetical protein
MTDNVIGCFAVTFGFLERRSFPEQAFKTSRREFSIANSVLD